MEPESSDFCGICGKLIDVWDNLFRGANIYICEKCLPYRCSACNGAGKVPSYITRKNRPSLRSIPCGDCGGKGFK